MCNNALVHWWSKVASVLATSTTEAELISAASCAQDVAFCRKLTNELGFRTNKAYHSLGRQQRLFSLARSGHCRDRSKHFALRFQFISDYIDRGILELLCIPTKAQLADLGTKACPCPQLQRMRPKLYGEVWKNVSMVVGFHLISVRGCPTMFATDCILRIHCTLIHANTQNYSGGDSVLWLMQVAIELQITLDSCTTDGYFPRWSYWA